MKISDPDVIRRQASAQVLLGAVLIGSNGLMVRFADTPPTVSAFWRMLLAGVLFALLLPLGPGWQALSRRTWLWLSVPAVAFALDLWMWHHSILLVGPGLSTLLANAQVFFMSLAGVLFFRERLSLRFAVGVLLAFAGLWLLLGGNWQQLAPDYRWGVWLGLGAGLAYTVYNIGLKRSQSAAARHGPVPLEQLLSLCAFGTAACLAPMALAEGNSLAIGSWRSFFILLALAGIGHCLSWALISRSIAVLPVGRVGLLLLCQPLVAYLLDVLVLDLAISARQWAGLGLSLGGIFVAGAGWGRKVRPAL